MILRSSETVQHSSSSAGCLLSAKPQSYCCTRNISQVINEKRVHSSIIIGCTLVLSGIENKRRNRFRQKHTRTLLTHTASTTKQKKGAATQPHSQTNPLVSKSIIFGMLTVSLAMFLALQYRASPILDVPLRRALSSLSRSEF